MTGVTFNPSPAGKPPHDGGHDDLQDHDGYWPHFHGPGGEADYSLIREISVEVYGGAGDTPEEGQ